MAKQQKKLLIIDGMSILYRAYHGGGQPLTLPDGRSITALYVFTKMLLRFMQHIEPTHLLVAFDVKGKTFRHETFDAYKATRSPMPEDLLKQLPLVHKFLKEAGIKELGLKGYEADDLIGTLARQASTKDENSEIYILSGDRDDLQLITDKINIVYPKKAGEFTIYTPSSFAEEYQFPVKSFLLYKALVGDTSDNIPGVSGIGKGTATKLLQKFSNLAELYEWVDNISEQQEAIPLEKRKIDASLKEFGLTSRIYQKLVAERENAYLSLALSTIDQYAPLDFIWDDYILPSFKNAELYKYLDQLYFTSLSQQFKSFSDNLTEKLVKSRKDTTASLPYTLMAEANDAKQEQDENKENSTKVDFQNKLNKVIISSFPQAYTSYFKKQEEIKDLVSLIQEDEEEQRRKSYLSEIASFSKNAPLYFIKLDFVEELKDYFKQNSFTKRKKILDFINNFSDFWLVLGFYEGKTEIKFVHASDLKYWVEVLGNDFFVVDELKNFLHQPDILKHLKDLSLTSLKERFHSLELYNYSLGYLKKNSIFATLLNPLIDNEKLNLEKEKILPTLIFEVDFSLLDNLVDGENVIAFFKDIFYQLNYLPYLFTWQKDTLAKNKKFFDFVNDVDLPLCLVVADMEKRGIKLDVPYLHRLKEEYETELQDLEQSILAYAKAPFNLQSPQQLSDFLFEDLKLPKTKKNKNAYSTSQEDLEELKDLHSVINLILRYRFVQKIVYSFVDPFLTLISENSTIHTTYQLNFTATGRLSSINPNLQNIPIRVEEGRRLRQAFIAREGYTFISADYSQIELRLLTHIADDKAMQEAYQNNLDIHKLTASAIFKLPLENIDFSMRQVGKTVNFSVIYGISPFSLAKDLNITYKEAKDYITSYYQRYPQISQYMTGVIAEAEQKGYISTLVGRKRVISEFQSSKHTDREFAKRVAMNAPIQGTAADLVRKAMLDFAISLRKHKLDAHLVAQIHDELIIEVREDLAEEVALLLQQVMSEAMQLKVPLVVSTHIASSWGGVK